MRKRGDAAVGRYRCPDHVLATFADAQRDHVGLAAILTRDPCPDLAQHSLPVRAPAAVPRVGSVDWVGGLREHLALELHVGRDVHVLLALVPAHVVHLGPVRQEVAPRPYRGTSRRDLASRCVFYICLVLTERDASTISKLTPEVGGCAQLALRHGGSTWSPARGWWGGGPSGRE